MEHHRPWNRSCRLRPARCVLALALGLVAATCPVVAQPSEEAPAPTLELEIGSEGYHLLEPNLLLVSFELRNTGNEPVVVAQRPGVFLGMSCTTKDGGMTGVVPGGIACGGDGSTFLELRPGDALLGEKVERLPKECSGDITVYGEFQTRTADAWDLPARKVTIHSKSILVRADDPKDEDPQ